MELDENTNVLDEVEVLFKKLESLPESLKRAAFNKIQEKLPIKDRLYKYTVTNEKKKRPGRKRKPQPDESEYDENKESEGQRSSENSEAEYVVEDILTSRGRKAKRISYAHMLGLGRNYEQVPEKSKKCSDVNDTEKKEVSYCDSHADLEIPVKRPRGRPKKIYKLVGKEDFVEKSLLKSNAMVSVVSTDEADEEVLVTDRTVLEVGNSSYSLENENSEIVDDPSVITEESTLITSNHTEEEEENSLVLEDGSVFERGIKIGKGMEDCSHTSAESLIWRKRKVPRTGNLACQECNFVTNNKSLLQIHSHRHTGVKQHVCPDCSKAFPQSSGLNVHMKRHRGQRDYPCDYCEYRAYTKVDKLRHMTIHTGERNQICQYCGKAFAKDSTLREHVRSIHEKPFKHICSECAFTTYRANNLRVHVRMRHRGEYNNHVCPVCGARVKQRNAFLEHMRAHTGEKPYRCNQCESSFACLARLTVHRKSVHEPRQFPCTDCSKVFQTKHHLLRHSVIHTKAKPFSCPFCTYSCNTQGNMTKHVKTIHHMPHFSYRKFKADQESVMSLTNSVNPEWVEKGQRVTEEYLKDLSSKLGRDITLDELRERETEKQKRINEEAEQAKIKRMNRYHTPEHSYHSCPGKITSLNSKSETLRLEGEEIVDPATLILQVAAQDADNFVDSVNGRELSSPPHVVQVDLLSEINGENPDRGEPLQVTVSPHIVEMLSNMNSDENMKGTTQVIHIQTSDTQESEVAEGTEFETVILPHNGEESDFVTGQVYELLSDHNLRLCLNAEFIETVDGNTIQVVRQEALSKRGDIYDGEQDSGQQVIDLGNRFLTNKGDINEETDTVVVIIKTDSTQENTL